MQRISRYHLFQSLQFQSLQSAKSRLTLMGGCFNVSATIKGGADVVVYTQCAFQRVADLSGSADGYQSNAADIGGIAWGVECDDDVFPAIVAGGIWLRLLFHSFFEAAIALYLSKLKPDGVLWFHVSNRYFNLPPVLGAIFNELGIAGGMRNEQDPKEPYVVTSQWMVFSRSKAMLDGVMVADKLVKKNEFIGQNVWSDKYYNILSILN